MRFDSRDLTVKLSAGECGGCSQTQPGCGGCTNTVPGCGGCTNTVPGCGGCTNTVPPGCERCTDTQCGPDTQREAGGADWQGPGSLSLLRRQLQETLTAVAR